MSSERSFVFAARAERVWDAITQLDRFPAWWSWLRDFRVDGAGLEAGTVLQGTIVPPLPYRLRLRVELDECVPAHHVLASVHGDLEGVALITFEDEGTSTRATASWTLEMMQQPMRFAARIAHPLLRWGHDRVVDATVESFRRHLNEVREG
jgi:uncharacterized protein YndB with AHSA1/START domain